MSRPSLSALQLMAVASVISFLAMPAFAGSQARIVRLSDVQGSVQIDKNTGLGFENAFLNLPVTQGAQLKTGQNGRAEIEFEDGSTMRLAPNSLVEFDTLGLTDAGKHVSTIKLDDGMVYVNWLGKSGDEFALNFSQEKIALDHPAHFRVAAAPDASKVAVFKGDVSVESPSGTVEVAKKKTATFDASEEAKYTIAGNIEPEALDSWDKESISYHDQYARNNTSPYGYGFSDMNYYGAFSNVPGYGMMWQPYFTGIGWDPFMDGAWSFYPGFGYMFVSAYPWGWMPYRYGNWNFVPGFGWMWQPGGWNSWVTTPRYTPTTVTTVHPPIAPTTGTVKTIAVGKGVVRSTLAPSQMILKSGSAGLGIPRGSLGNLHHLNGQVAKNGFAEVHAAPQFATSSPRTSGFGAPHGSSQGVPHSTVSTSSMGHASSASHASSGSHH
ncbi:MAG TPA: FecR family protein [Candidatus Solibacter sp.]|nr:FecR family protein [Candidatus Solibacter sp.]